MTGTSVAVQEDRKIRFEQAEDAYRRHTPSDEGKEAEQGGDLLWIHDGRYLWSRYEEAGRNPDDECGVREFFVDHDRIPEEYGDKWTRPMMAAELPEEFLGHEFTIDKQFLEGKPVYVLRSVGRIPLSPDNSMGVTMWVDPETSLVVRLESDGAWHPAGEGEAYVDGEYDISYDFGIPVAADAFDIEIGERAEDLTDTISHKIREKLEWQGKLPKSDEASPNPAVEMEAHEWRCPPIG